ncbi:toprim domain-containing protein [Nonomuraea sp. NPDC050556]|uniref:toprim domain-containing protein n=1 Tax=Nonomuraea sp. NPDC050556 TaxID=3364369 RepID=UPI00379902C0
METYVDQLDEEALEYLTGPKRLLTEQTIAEHRFGVVRSPEPGHEAVRDYIAIPYLAPDGTVLSIRFRRLDAQDLDLTGSVELPKRTPKYRSMPGDIPRPYGTEALQRGTRNIVLTEGEFDRAVSNQCDLPAIGIPGANVWEKVWRRLLVQFDGIFVLHDDDDAGRELVTKISNSGLDAVRPIPMSGGDVTSFYATHGRDGLRAKLGA